MYPFPKEPQKIRARIRRYERELRQEYEKFHGLHDGGGKRYLLGPLYMLLGDLTGALPSFAWFERTFPDDAGEPGHYLCWTLALYRSGDRIGATYKLRQTMLSNLYMIPHLLGQEQEELDIWHGSNWKEKGYLEEVPREFFELWDEAALQWAQETYQSSKLSQVRQRYIAIYEQLKEEPVGPQRTRLVREAAKLRGRPRHRP